MGQPFKSFRTTFSESVNKPSQTDDFIEFLTPVFDELKLTKQFLVVNKSTVEDRRIQQLLIELDQCLYQGGIILC